jgi:antitoxin Phd
MAWQLQEAKQHFSEVVRRALAKGPQYVTCRGERGVVVLAARDYERLRDPGGDFKTFLQAGPPISLSRQH